MSGRKRVRELTREEVERWCEANGLVLSDDIDSDDVEGWCGETSTRLCKEWDYCRCTYIEPVIMCVDHERGEHKTGVREMHASLFQVFEPTFRAVVLRQGRRR
jgi:hypothetical protein